MVYPEERGVVTDLGKEFILLSDVLGVSILVDSINNMKPSEATEGTVLGPFFTEDARDGMFSIVLCLISLLIATQSNMEIRSPLKEKVIICMSKDVFWMSTANRFQTL